VVLDGELIWETNLREIEVLLTRECLVNLSLEGVLLLRLRLRSLQRQRRRLRRRVLRQCGRKEARNVSWKAWLNGWT